MPRPALAFHLINRRTLSTSTADLILRFCDAVKHVADHPPPPAPSPRHPNPISYNTLMKSFARAGNTDHVLHLFDEMQSLNCAPDVVCYTTVIDSLVSSGRAAAAVTLFIKMVSSGVTLDPAAYTILVKLYACHLQQFDLAFEVLFWMEESGCNPDVVTYSTLIAGLCRAGMVEEGLGVLDVMLERGCRPNVYTFTPLIHGYCASGRVLEAKRLFDTMESIPCPPNTVTYNILVNSLCRIGLFDEVEKVLAESSSKGWEPDTVTYSTYMDGLCKRGEADRAFKLLDEMLANGVYPNTWTLNILLDGLCCSSRTWEAKCLLERSAELEWVVGVVNYNTVMSRLCDAGKWLAVMKLFTDMIKKGIEPNTRSFSILIHSLCRSGKLRKAKCVLDSKGFVPNVVTYTTLLHYLYDMGMFDEVHRLFDKMCRDNITPNSITYGIVIDCLCREGKLTEAMDCFHRSLEDGYSPNLVARLTYWLIRGRKHRGVLNLFQWMSEQGFFVDVCIYHSLIKVFCLMGYCKSTKIDKVCHILDIMLRMR